MVKKLLARSVRTGSSILFQKQTSIFSGAVVIAVMLLASALLGLVKKRLYASVITPGPELDVFFTAFRIPDILFQLMIAGALNAAFIPIFAGIIEKYDQKRAWDFLSSLFNVVSVILLIFSLISWVFAPQLIWLIGGGFTGVDRDVLIGLMRILLFSTVLLSLSSIAAGVLQSFKRFFLPFLAPLAYNLGAILGIVVFYPIWGIYGAAYGVIVGALAHLLIQIPALIHLGYHYRPVFLSQGGIMQKIARLSFPRTIGVGIDQIKTIIVLNIASFLPRGGISALDLAQSISFIPVSMFGVSVAQASFPEFATLHAKGDREGLARTFESSFNQILFFVLPVSVVLVVLKIPVVRLIYGAGAFDWQDTVATAWVLAAFAIGLSMQAVNALIVRLYFAMHETKIPLYAGVVGVILSVAVSGLILIYNFTQGSAVIALGFSIGAAGEMLVLLVPLFERKMINHLSFFGTSVKILVASILAGITMYIPIRILDQEFLDTSRVVNLVILVWLVLSFGVTTYLISSFILGIDQLKIVVKILVKIQELRKSFEDTLKSPRILAPPAAEDISN